MMSGSLQWNLIYYICSQKHPTMLLSIVKKSFFIPALIAVSGYVFAVSGTTTGDDRSNKMKVYSNLKTAIPFSLRYGHNYTGSKTFNFTKTDQYMVMNSVITYQRGNVVYVVPHQNKIKLPSFIKIGPSYKSNT